MNYKDERKTALDAVLKACRLGMLVRDSLIAEDTLNKKDKSPVTVADYGVQAVVLHHLSKSFPADLIVGEEDSALLRKPENEVVKDKVVNFAKEIESSLTEKSVLEALDRGNHPGGAKGRHWTLDPIDGTKGFLRGEQYAIALALIVDGEVVLGALGCPNMHLDLNNPKSDKGCIFIAVKGQGAYMRTLNNPKEIKIAVDSITDPAQVVFCESVESGHTSHSDSEKIAAILGVKVTPLRIDSQCKYAAVARGDASLYLRLPTRPDYEEKIWDHAAGWVVIKEAGGEVSDIWGNPLDFSRGRTLQANKGVVVTNGKIHHQVVEAVKQVIRI